jgi:hypothetical protein
MSHAVPLEGKNPVQFFDIAKKCNLGRENIKKQYQTILNTMLTDLFADSFQIKEINPIALNTLTCKITKKNRDSLECFLKTHHYKYFSNENIRTMFSLGLCSTWLFSLLTVVPLVWVYNKFPEGKGNKIDSLPVMTIISAGLAGISHIITSIFYGVFKSPFYDKKELKDRLYQLFNNTFIDERKEIDVKKDEDFFKFLTNAAEAIEAEALKAAEEKALNKDLKEDTNQ